MKFKYNANKKKKQIMTERPNASSSRGNVSYHEIKWYYGRNKGFGISSMAYAFISCLTLSSYQIWVFAFSSVKCTYQSYLIGLLWEINSTKAQSQGSPGPSVNVGCFSSTSEGSDQLLQETRDCLAYLLVHRCILYGSR